VFETSLETLEDLDILTNCLLESCGEYSRGFCQLNRPFACYWYHQPKQRRRPIFSRTGQLRYWDRLCPHTSCPRGEVCPFAHSKVELAYHPARFRIKLCNGIECRGSVCCFAHSVETLRSHAPSMYGYFGAADSGTTTASSSARTEGGQCMHRMCDHFPDCQYGDKCFFAHSWEEVGGDKFLDPSLPDFYPVLFKTKWCPFSQQHEWNACPYAHNWHDSRRPASIGYGPSPCPYWDRSDFGASSYSDRCPHGVRCPFAHGRKEQLYHPVFYKTQDCCDWRTLTDGCCPRGDVCAFAHGEAERRFPGDGGHFRYDQLLAEDVVLVACRHQLSLPVITPVERKENLDMHEFLKFILESS
jgi:hypothetical protein